MFYLNLGYKWTYQTVEGLEAAILLPCGNSAEKLLRSRPDVRNLLLDPQLYLAELDCNDCAKVCARLVGYPWFGAHNVPGFDSDAMTRRDWERSMRDNIANHWRAAVPDINDAEDACRAAIEFQLALGCSPLILPSPLLRDREDEAGTQAAWLDAGIQAARLADADEPILATIAVSDIALNAAAFEAFGILDTLVDQVTSREGVAGTYIVISQAVAGHPFASPEIVSRAYRYLCKAFANAGYEYVITNFADVFGLACHGLGATGFATGQSHALRRLSFSGFDDESFGRALPYLYSHAIVGELASETDLDVLRDRRLLRRVRDVTPSSERLMTVLEGGGSASTVLAWAENQNNVAAAHTHFLWRMIQADKALNRLSASERIESVTDWLETASGNVLYIRERIGTMAYNRLKGKIAPADRWLDVIDS
jgi:hypothetical protein